MTDDDDVTQSGVLDIGDHGIHPLADGDGGQVARLAAVAGQVHSQCPQLRCLPAQFGHGEIPAVGGVFAAVD